MTKSHLWDNLLEIVVANYFGKIKQFNLRSRVGSINLMFYEVTTKVLPKKSGTKNIFKTIKGSGQSVVGLITSGKTQATVALRPPDLCFRCMPFDWYQDLISNTCHTSSGRQAWHESLDVCCISHHQILCWAIASCNGQWHQVLCNTINSYTTIKMYCTTPPANALTIMYCKINNMSLTVTEIW